MKAEFSEVAVGARVMLTANMDFDMGAVNGAAGTVVALEYGAQAHTRHTIVGIRVKLDGSGHVIRVRRTDSRHLYQNCKRYYKQTFPLTLAYAITGAFDVHGVPDHARCVCPMLSTVGSAAESAKHAHRHLLAGTLVLTANIPLHDPHTLAQSHLFLLRTDLVLLFVRLCNFGLAHAAIHMETQPCMTCHIWPICACACLAGHRSQGATLRTKTIIDVTDAFTPGLLYVMLSRVTDRKHLHLVRRLTPDMFVPMKVPGHEGLWANGPTALCVGVTLPPQRMLRPTLTTYYLVSRALAASCARVPRCPGSHARTCSATCSRD